MGGTRRGTTVWWCGDPALLFCPKDVVMMADDDDMNLYKDKING